MISITIDGPSGAGKSTVAKLLANRLGFHHLNTGALYRAVTFGCMREGILPDNDKEIAEFITKCNLKVIFDGQEQKVFISGEDVTKHLRLNDVSTKTPQYSASPAVREGVTKISRNLTNEMNLVLDGRDSGSYVLPNATFKFYLDASAKERATRRRKELLANGEDIPLEILIRQIEERDRFDMCKKVAPLVVPKDAVIIDSTHLNIQETVEELLKHINI